MIHEIPTYNAICDGCGNDFNARRRYHTLPEVLDALPKAGWRTVPYNGKNVKCYCPDCIKLATQIPNPSKEFD